MPHVGPGDTIVISALEHHANILPWQRVVAARNAQLRVIPMHADGTLNLANLKEIICPGTKLISITHTSNALGTLVDLAPIIQQARGIGERRARILLLRGFLLDALVGACEESVSFVNKKIEIMVEGLRLQ